MIAADTLAAAEWPAGKNVEPRTWLPLLENAVAQCGQTELLTAVRDSICEPDNPEVLYALGYELIDAGAPLLAASVLWHCLAIVGDNEEVVCELSSALEIALAYDDAYAILDQRADLRRRSFLCEYLHAYNATMTGRLDVARESILRLTPDSPDAELMKSTAETLLALAAVRPVDDRDRVAILDRLKGIESGGN